MAGAALDHRREERSRHQHRSLEVDPQGAPHLLGAEVGESAGSGQPGVGDQDLDLARLGGEPLGRARLGKVGRQDAVSLAGKLRRQRLERLGLTSAEDEARPPLRQRHRDRTPEPPGRPGEQRIVAGKFHPRPQASTRPAERNRG